MIQSPLSYKKDRVRMPGYLRYKLSVDRLKHHRRLLRNLNEKRYHSAEAKERKPPAVPLQQPALPLNDEHPENEQYCGLCLQLGHLPIKCKVFEKAIIASHQYHISKQDGINVCGSPEYVNNIMNWFLQMSPASALSGVAKYRTRSVARAEQEAITLSQFSQRRFKGYSSPEY